MLKPNNTDLQCLIKSTPDGRGKERMGDCTEGSHSSEPFFTQVNHLISSNRFSKQVMNPADFPTLKIWDQSDH